MKIGYLGPAGTHSQDAADVFARQFLPQAQAGDALLPYHLMPMPSFTHILEAVEESALDLGCVPVENALEGSVSEVLDSLALRLEKTRIIAQFVRPVRHALIRRYEFADGIKFVHSHPQALGQCRQALYDLLGPDIKIFAAPSTSAAVKSLLSQDETHAAIGTARAAKHYGLDVVQDNLGNLDHNATVFLIVTAQPDLLANAPFPEHAPTKTTLCLGAMDNRPGALLRVLTLLADFGLNMSKIESRPSKQCLGEYLFYIDIEGRVNAEAENRLRREAPFYRSLGVFPALGTLMAL